MNLLSLAVAARLLQSLRESGASRVLNQLLPALLLLGLALMYASSSLGLMPAQPLYPRRHLLAGVHGPQHTLLPLLQAQHHVAAAIRTRGWLLAEKGMSPDSGGQASSSRARVSTAGRSAAGICVSYSTLAMIRRYRLR